MIKYLTSPLFTSILSIAILLTSIYLSYSQRDSGWVASAGAMISLFGILLTTRVILRHKTNNDVFKSQNTSISDLPSLPIEDVVDLENENKIKEQKLEKEEKLKDIRSQKFGVWFLIMGTIIWAYGDRLFELFYNCNK